MPRLRERGIPASEPSRVGRTARRTTLVRAGFAAALCATLALAFVVASSQDVRRAPLIPSGTTGMLVLDLSASVSEGGLEATVAKLSSTDERTGLVVFSDGAYELLPPGSPSRELASLLRFFKVRADGSAPRNPWEEMRAGTRISVGMSLAHDVLVREDVKRGSIVLVSDLGIGPDEIARLSEVLADIRTDGFEIRIVPLLVTADKRALVEELLDPSSFAEAPEEETVRTADERSIGAAAPWLFLLAGSLLVIVLATNEGVLPRLEVGR